MEPRIQDDTKDEKELLTWADDENAICMEPQVDIWAWRNIGFLGNYFCIGIVYGALPSTLYSLFLIYLNVPAHVYATASVLVLFPWSFKIFWGVLSDTVPLCGHHRKPYLIIGWSICSLGLIILSMYSIPDPYYCRDDRGYYTKEICNANAPDSAGAYTAMMGLIAFGYVISDVSADSLLVEYAQKEPIEVRGNIQSTVYLIRTCGQIAAQIMLAVGMNGKEYGGEFVQSLTFNQVCTCLSIPSILMMPLSYFCVQEQGGQVGPPVKEYASQAWELLRSKAAFYVICYSFLSPLFDGVTSPASGPMKSVWAKVGNLQNQMFGVLGYVLFAIGLWITKKYLLDVSWRLILVTTAVVMNITDMFFTFVIVSGTIRNQYFFISDGLLDEIPASIAFIVSSYVIVELADHGNQGMVYGLMTTFSNVGNPVARAIGNQIYGCFSPSLSETQNYVADTTEFRYTVGWSFLLQYGLTFVGLLFVYLLPKQKEEAQLRKANWPKNDAYAWISVITLSVALLYSTSLNVMVMVPKLSCLKVVGGSGCQS